jgi:hypothetical protein
MEPSGVTRTVVWDSTTGLYGTVAVSGSNLVACCQCTSDAQRPVWLHTHYSGQWCVAWLRMGSTGECGLPPEASRCIVGWLTHPAVQGVGTGRLAVRERCHWLQTASAGSTDAMATAGDPQCLR